MIKRSFVCILFFIMAMPAYSAQLFLIEFDLFEGDKLIDRGKTTVTKKPHTWTRGLTRSYLKLRCNKQQDGKTEKLLSTVDLFTGLDVSHSLVGAQLELKVKYSTVKPRLAAIRALTKGQCENLSPIFTTTTESYTFPATDLKNESRPFGENMSFRIKVRSLDSMQ